MAELEEQIAEVVTNAVEEILRLVGRDDIDLPSTEVATTEAPSRPAGRQSPRQPSTSDPILAGFLGLDR